jgi:hypothetical protein
MSADMKAMLETLKTELGPILAAAAGDAAKIAVAAEVAKLGPVGPVVAAAAPPVIDAVDSFVMSLLGIAPAPGSTAAPTDTESRVSALEKHVAALTVVTGSGTSAPLVNAKATATPVAMPEPAAAA